MNSSDKADSRALEALFQGILQLKNMDECYSFFEDLFSPHELRAFAQRLEVAEMLQNGKTYTDIVEATGASTATISRCNKALTKGTNGLNAMLKRLAEEEAKAEECKTDDGGDGLC